MSLKRVRHRPLKFHLLVKHYWMLDRDTRNRTLRNGLQKKRWDEYAVKVRNYLRG